MSRINRKVSIAEIERRLADGVSEDDIVLRLIEQHGLSLRRAQDRLMVARGYGDTIAVNDHGVPLSPDEQRRLWDEHLHDEP